MRQKRLAAGLLRIIWESFTENRECPPPECYWWVGRITPNLETGRGLFLAPGARHGAKKHISRHRSDHRRWAVDDTAASSANGAGSERFLRKTGTHLQTAGASVPD